MQMHGQLLAINGGTHTCNPMQSMVAGFSWRRQSMTTYQCNQLGMQGRLTAVMECRSEGIRHSRISGTLEQ